MPFVAMIKESVKEHGISAIEQQCQFDQMRVLNESADYLKNTLNIQEIDIQAVHDGLDASLAERIAPGHPIVVFS